MRISGPSKYVNLFLVDLVESDPKGKVSDFAKRFKESKALQRLIYTIYPNIRVTAV